MSVVLAERSGEVLVLTLNRPEKANAVNEAMHGALVEHLARADEGIRAVVLAAAGGRVFSAGVDLKEFSDLERTTAARKRRALLKRTLNAMLDFPKPLVAAVQGKALGAGCMLALLADEVVMSASAVMGLPEVKLGMPSPVGYVIVAARAGTVLARQMVQRGEPVGAERALLCGLADEISEAAKERAVERARALASVSGNAYQVNKKFMNGALRAALHAAFAEVERL